METAFKQLQARGNITIDPICTHPWGKTAEFSTIEGIRFALAEIPDMPFSDDPARPYIGHVAIRCADFTAMQHFYGDVLGFTRTSTGPDYAIIVHKFDHFARNRTESLAVKSLLRHDYGIKVFSVSEPSEDSDGPMGALIEGIMESVADWYSQNLAAETAKGKKERAHKGRHNNRAPFGMKKNAPKILVPDENELPGLKMAYETYATDKYGDTDIAKLLNDAGYRSKTGRRFSKETVRDILQNQTYLGKIKYQKHKRHFDGRRSYDEPVELFDGEHEAVIDEEIFDKCQQVRSKRGMHYQATTRYNSGARSFC